MSKSPATLQELRTSLARVRAAIARIEDGGIKNATTTGGTTTDAYANLDLDTLYKRETQLLNQIAAHKNGIRKPIRILRSMFR